jgi:hypothetical protein
MGNSGSEDALNADDGDDTAGGGGVAGSGSGNTLGDDGDTDNDTGGNTGDDTGDVSMVSVDFGESGYEERSTNGSVADDKSADVGKAGDTRGSGRYGLVSVQEETRVKL